MRCYLANLNVEVAWKPGTMPMLLTRLGLDEGRLVKLYVFLHSLRHDLRISQHFFNVITRILA